MTLGAWLLLLGGLLSIFAPSDLASSAVLRLMLVATGFVLFGHGQAARRKTLHALSGASETTHLRQLGGWLVVLGSLLGVTLVSAVFAVIQSAPQLVPGQHWVELSIPISANYNPAQARMMLLEWGGHLFVVAAFSVLLALFLQRRRAFRPAAIAIFLLLVPVAGVKLWLVNQPPVLSAATQAAQFWWLVLAVVQAAVWVPYLLRSRRARLAFTL